jgi:hypothetical protein
VRAAGTANGSPGRSGRRRPGLATENPAPFFTTKAAQAWSRVSREIIENHGGTITLENRVRNTGCLARVSLPLLVPYSTASMDARHEQERSEGQGEGAF